MKTRILALALALFACGGSVEDECLTRDEVIELCPFATWISPSMVTCHWRDPETVFFEIDDAGLFCEAYFE